MQRSPITSLEQAMEAINGGLVKFADPSESIVNEPSLSGVRVDDKLVSLCSVGSMSMWVGVQKSGKSTMLAMLCASVLKDIDHTIFSQEKKARRVLYVDTEQPRKYANRSIKKIYRYLGFADGYEGFRDRISYMEVKDFSIKEILLIVKAALELAIKENNPFDFLALDGVADLVINVNDPEECDQLIRELGALCEQYLLHLAAVIHANPGNYGDIELKARGHLGSALMRKVESVVTMKKDRESGIFTIDFPYLRDGNIPKRELEFSDYDGLLHPMDEQVQHSKKQNECYAMFARIADMEGTIYLKDVCEALAYGEKRAMSTLDEAIRLGVVERNGAGPHGKTRWRLIKR